MVVSIDFITHLYVVYTKAVCYLSCGHKVTTEFAQNTKKIKISTSELPKLTISPSVPTSIEHPQEMHSEYLRAILPEFSVICRTLAMSEVVTTLMLNIPRLE